MSCVFDFAYFRISFRKGENAIVDRYDWLLRNPFILGPSRFSFYAKLLAKVSPSVDFNEKAFLTWSDSIYEWDDFYYKNPKDSFNDVELELCHRPAKYDLTEHIVDMLHNQCAPWQTLHRIFLILVNFILFSDLNCGGLVEVSMTLSIVMTQFQNDDRLGIPFASAVHNLLQVLSRNGEDVDDGGPDIDEKEIWFEEDTADLLKSRSQLSVFDLAISSEILQSFWDKRWRLDTHGHCPISEDVNIFSNFHFIPAGAVDIGSNAKRIIVSAGDDEVIRGRKERTIFDCVPCEFLELEKPMWQLTHLAKALNANTKPLQWTCSVIQAREKSNVIPQQFMKTNYIAAIIPFHLVQTSSSPLKTCVENITAGSYKQFEFELMNGYGMMLRSSCSLQNPSTTHSLYCFVVRFSS